MKLTNIFIFSDSLNFSNIRLNARTRLLNVLDITFSSDYDPYIVNTDKTNRINQFELSSNKRLARLKSFTTSVGLRINDESFNDKQDNNDDEKKDTERSFYDIPWNSYDIPWNAKEFHGVS